MAEVIRCIRVRFPGPIDGFATLNQLIAIESCEQTSRINIENTIASNVTWAHRVIRKEG